MTLCNLSTHPDCKTPLVALHGLPPLIDMLEGDSDLVKRYAAMTLCNLSTLAENQVYSLFTGVERCDLPGYVQVVRFLNPWGEAVSR